MSVRSGDFSTPNHQINRNELIEEKSSLYQQIRLEDVQRRY